MRRDRAVWSIKEQTSCNKEQTLEACSAAEVLRGWAWSAQSRVEFVLVCAPASACRPLCRWISEYAVSRGLSDTCADVQPGCRPYQVFV